MSWSASILVVPNFFLIQRAQLSHQPMHSYTSCTYRCWKIPWHGKLWLHVPSDNPSVLWWHQHVYMYCNQDNFHLESIKINWKKLCMAVEESESVLHARLATHLQEWVTDAMDIMLWRVSWHNQVLQHSNQVGDKLEKEGGTKGEGFILIPYTWHRRYMYMLFDSVVMCNPIHIHVCIYTCTCIYMYVYKVPTHYMLHVHVCPRCMSYTYIRRSCVYLQRERDRERENSDKQ